MSLLQETIAQIHADESDTLLYIPHRDIHDNNRIILYELYRDQNAFEYHENQPYIKKFLTERQQHLQHNPEVNFLEPISDLTSVFTS